MAVNTITFGGVTSSAYDIYISGEGVFNAPKRNVSLIEVPGRNGKLSLDEGCYDNIEVVYPAFNFEADLNSFRTKLADFRNALASQSGYQELSDTFHPDEYRMAMLVDGIDIDPIKYNTASKFDIKFNCKPQRFLNSGKNVYTRTASGSISNPTQFDARPLLVVTGTGNLTVNGVQIAIAESPTTIDCEAMEAYNGTTSRNSDIVLTPNQFPVLKPGNNTITLGAGITKVEITPRWWRI